MKVDVWIVCARWKRKADRVAAYDAAVKSGLSFKMLYRQYFCLVGKTLFYKGLPVKNLPKVVFFYSRIPVLRKYLRDKNSVISINSEASVNLVVDKLKTHNALAAHSILQPEYIVASNKATYDEIKEKLGSEFIVKKIDSRTGKHVFLVKNDQEFKEAVNKTGPEAIYQQYIKESFGRDIRVMVVNDKAVYALERSSASGDFRSNLSQGGTVKVLEVTKELEQLAVKIAKILGGTFISVDFLYGPNDSLIFCESNIHASGANTRKLTGVNIVEPLFDYIKTLVS